MSEEKPRQSFRIQIETMPHGGYVVSEEGENIYAATSAADLCYWLENVLSGLDIKPDTPEANPLPSFLRQPLEAARAMITGRAK